MRFVSNQVAEPVGGRRVDEAITYPLARLNTGKTSVKIKSTRKDGDRLPLRNLGDELNSIVHAFIADVCSGLECSAVCVAIEAKDIVGVVGGDGNQVTGARTRDLQRSEHEKLKIR